jgi:hypothetical protein
MVDSRRDSEILFSRGHHELYPTSYSPLLLTNFKPWNVRVTLSCNNGGEK